MPRLRNTYGAALDRRTSFFILLAAVVLVGCGGSKEQPQPSGEKAAPASKERIVIVGGPLAEIVYAIGAGESVVGTDITCAYPAAAAATTKIGYQRTIAAEQVLSLNPTLVIASDEAGPPTAMEQLKGAGVRVEVVPGGHTPEAARTKITTVARILGRENEGRVLAETLDRDLAAYTPATGAGPRVMYLHGRGGGTMYAAGTETSADAMIRLAGGTNAVAGYTGYRPLTPEAGLEAAPDYIMVSSAVMGQIGGIDALLKVPGIAGTPAAARRQVIPVDDLYMLGFGPRLGRARAELAGAFAGKPAGQPTAGQPTAGQPAADTPPAGRPVEARR